MVAALNLEQRKDRARQDEDAHRDWDYQGTTHRLLVECKSAPQTKEFGTGRDVGLAKLETWRKYHFVFGWFEARDNVPIRMWYGSPRMMRPWIEREIAYLLTDLQLAEFIPGTVGEEAVTRIFGEQQEFSYSEINKLIKNEWNANQAKGLPNRYVEYADIRQVKNKTSDNIYSRAAALQAARDRVAYLLNRGATVNNRKIPAKYVTEHCAELNKRAWVKSLDAVIEEELSLEPPNNPLT